jgi:hypothetical protein
VRAAWNRRTPDTSPSPEGLREALNLGALAYEFVRAVGHLDHPGDDGYAAPEDPEDGYEAVASLIAQAREIMATAPAGGFPAVATEALARAPAQPELFAENANHSAPDPVGLVGAVDRIANLDLTPGEMRRAARDALAAYRAGGQHSPDEPGLGRSHD